MLMEQEFVRYGLVVHNNVLNSELVSLTLKEFFEKLKTLLGKRRVFLSLKFKSVYLYPFKALILTNQKLKEDERAKCFIFFMKITQIKICILMMSLLDEM